MTTVTIVERKHAGRGAVFILDGDESARFYIATCCTASEVVSVDVEHSKCSVTCAAHNSITRRTFYPVMTDADRSVLNDRVYGSLPAFNPPTDPDGERQQRARLSGYSTEAWHRARGL